MAAVTDDGTPRRRRAKAEPAPTTPDPVEIAMEAEAAGAVPGGIARELLANQNRLVGWQIASERAGFALKVLTGLVGLAAAVGLGVMAWNAARDESMVVRPFSAPPSWTARGFGGDVLAGRYSDHIVALQQSAALGFLSVQVLRGNSDEVRVEIPQTGMSLGDIQRMLTAWLGHQKVVSGALSEDGSGQVTLTVRVAGQRSFSLTGRPEEVDAMINRLAEQSFAAAEPQRAVLAFLNLNRDDDAARVASAHLASLENGSPELPLALVFRAMGEPSSQQQGQFVLQAVAADPNLMTAWARLAIAEAQLGREQSAYDAAARAVATRDADQPRSYSRLGLRRMRANAGSYMARLTGDFAAVVVQGRQGAAFRSWMAAQGHETSTARRIADDALMAGRISADGAARTRVHIAHALQDWPAMSAALDDYRVARADWMSRSPGPGLPPRAQTARWQAGNAETQARAIDPLRAIALAHTSRIDEARQVAAATPLDCAPCLRARAEVETVARNGPGADVWYAKALALGSRLPLTEAAWAASRLERGDPAGAAAKAALAVAKGPRYADPLELWGEALLAQSDARGAAAKFAAAAKLAPRWGRLHLKWGEALAKLGEADEARAKWRAAAAMDLTLAERAELAALSRERTI